MFNEQAYAGGNAEHSTHHVPGALLTSKLCEQADGEVGLAGLLEQARRRNAEILHGSGTASKTPTMFLSPGKLRWKLYVAAVPWLSRYDGWQVHAQCL